MKKVLVLGGTGAMGVYLVPELANYGYDVWVTTRGKKESLNENLHYLQGDAHDAVFLKGILENQWDAIIDFMVYSTEEFKKVVGRFMGATAQYFYLSSYRVFADSDVPITEASNKLLETSEDKEYLKTDEYALAKARQEKIVRTYKENNWTIIRPSITYSSNRFQLVTWEADIVVLRSLQNLSIPLSEEVLRKKTTMTWAGDVAKMITLLIGNPLAFGEDFNVVTHESRTWQEVAECYKQSIGLKYELVSAKDYLEVVPGKYQLLYDRMFDREMDNAKVLAVTGLSKNSLKYIGNGLKEELARIKENPTVLKRNISLEGKIDRVLKTKTNLAGVDFKSKLKYCYHRYGLEKIYRKLK